MSEPLKACPFCKFADEVIVGGEHPRPGLRACAEASEAKDRYWWIECDNCLSQGPVARDEQNARKQWNTRAQSPAFGTAELLRIADEMEGEYLFGFAARIRAACSPEAVAFVEASREWCRKWAIHKGGQPWNMQDEHDTHETMHAAYRAMLAAQEKAVPNNGGGMARQPTIRDREVRVRAYLTDEAFGYDHWRAAQFAAPKEALPGLLLIFDTEEERDAAIGSFKWPVP